jgi:hypothetical protein
MAEVFLVKSKIAMILAVAAMLGSSTSAAMAYNLAGNTDIRTGFGDEIVVHHGLFGTKETLVKDRLGDGYIKKHGVLGTSESGFNLLGNSYVKKKGLIGGTEVQASSIFGDRMESKKSFFGLGRRQTNVDLSGVGSMVQGIFANHHFINSGMAMGQPAPMPDALAPGGMPNQAIPAPGVRPNWSPANIPNNPLDQAAGLGGAPPQPTP